MNFEWFFNDSDFLDSKASMVEDDIFGYVCTETKKGKYLVDIHKEYYGSRDHGYDLEVYNESEDGGHGAWLGSLHGIRTSATLERFKRRAEKLLTAYIAREEAA